MFYERKLDNLGRLTLPTSLIRCTISIFAGDIAFCYKNENEVILKDAQETVETDMILFIEEIDEENRITLPLEMQDSFQKFMIYIQNHELILRGVP